MYSSLVVVVVAHYFPDYPKGGDRTQERESKRLLPKKIQQERKPSLLFLQTRSIARLDRRLIGTPRPLPTPLIPWIIDLVRVHPSIRALMRIRNRQATGTLPARTVRCPAARAPFVAVPRRVQLVAGVAGDAHEHAGVALD